MKRKYVVSMSVEVWATDEWDAQAVLGRALDSGTFATHPDIPAAHFDGTELDADQTPEPTPQ